MAAAAGGVNRERDSPYGAATPLAAYPWFLIFAFRSASGHRPNSLFSTAARSSGVPPTGSAPWAFNLSRISGLRSASFVAAFSRSTATAGVPGDTVYIVESGRVKVAQHAESGREMILWFCLPGEAFGLAASPRIGPRLVEAQACTDSTILCIPSARFQEYLRAHPRASLELVNLLLCRVYVLCDGILNLSAEHAERRLSRLLLQLRHRYGRVQGDEICLDIALTQQEIADMIGTSRQTVSELLNRMKARGEVRARGRRLYVPV